MIYYTYIFVFIRIGLFIFLVKNSLINFIYLFFINNIYLFINKIFIYLLILYNEIIKIIIYLLIK